METIEKESTLYQLEKFSEAVRKFANEIMDAIPIIEKSAKLLSKSLSELLETAKDDYISDLLEDE